MADIDECRIGKDLALVRQSEPALTHNLRVPGTVLSALNAHLNFTSAFSR